MGREPKTASERTQPLREAWEELHAAYRTVLVQVGFEPVSQAAGAEALQAVTECTRRLREIAADFGVDDEDEAP
jgi:hypothetical protein